MKFSNLTLGLYPRLSGSGASGPPDSLVAHWTLDEESGVRADSLGTYDLTDDSAVGFTAGKLGNAASFDQDTFPFQSLFNTTDVLLPGTGDFSVTLWFRANATGFATKHVFGDANVTNGDPGSFSIQYGFSGDRIQFTVFDAGDAGTNSVEFSGLTRETWYFLACRYDASTQTVSAKLDNGAPVSNVMLVGPRGVGVANTYVGGDGVGSSFAGEVDEVTVFNELLSDGQVAFMFGSGTPPEFPFAGFPG